MIAIDKERILEWVNAALLVDYKIKAADPNSELITKKIILPETFHNYMIAAAITNSIIDEYLDLRFAITVDSIEDDIEDKQENKNDNFIRLNYTYRYSPRRLTSLEARKYLNNE